MALECLAQDHDPTFIARKAKRGTEEVRAPMGFRFFRSAFRTPHWSKDMLSFFVIQHSGDLSVLSTIEAIIIISHS